MKSAFVSGILAQRINLLAKDGYSLAANFYPSLSEFRGNLIVAGATGVQQRFYRRFAEYACRRGYSVLTLDYRGIGESKPESLKGFEMSYFDWGSLDLEAAVEYLDDGVTPIYWIGHSFGSQALGLISSHSKISAAYCFGVGAGWAGWMPWWEGLKARFLWTCVMPIIVAFKGYMAWSLLGMGDDLPKGVYKYWRRWCKYPNHLFGDPEMADFANCFAEVTVPCVFANAKDDPWSSPNSRDAFIRGFSSAPILTRDLSPAENEKIGHMGYFKASASPLWEEALQWFSAAEVKNELVR